MNEQLAWKHLSGSDEKLADRALAILQQRYLPALHSYLRNAGMVNNADRDDLISKGFLKLWLARMRINCPNESAGRSYLFTIVSRCMIDAIRAYAKARTVTVDELVGTDDELTEKCSPEAEAYTRIITSQLVAAANCLWLGLDASLLPATHTRQLVAARLYYLESCTLEEIVQLLQTARPAGEPKLTVHLLEEWMSDEGVLRFFAFEQLCYESARLLTVILGIPKVTPSLLSNLWQAARKSPPSEPAFAELSWAAVAIAIMRYQHSIPYDEVAGARHEVVQSWGYTQSEIVALLELLRRRLPFCRDTEALLERLHCRNHKAAAAQADILGSASLWKRLSFQYCYMMDLAQKDIIERVQQPARISGYIITESKLNSWLSGKRLQKRFLQYWKELYGDPENG